MSDCRDIAPAIAFHVNGTLDAGERGRVAEHVASCAGCAALLGQAQRQRDAAPMAGAACLEHVHPELLRQYVDEPAQLERETIAWIASRLDACTICADAVDRLREVQRSLAAAQRETPSPAPRWRSWIAPLLQPAAAASYLALLVVAVLLLWRQPSATAPTPGALVPRAVESERALRDAGAPPAPLGLQAGGWVALTLVTDLRAADLEDPALAFRVETTRDGRVIWQIDRSGADFHFVGDRAALTVVLDAGSHAAEAVYEIAVRAVKPGDPLDGQALFRRRLEVQAE